jgi:hypothetical protein
MANQPVRGRREFLKAGVSAFMALPALSGQEENGAEIPIVVGARASELQKLAAEELSKHLQALYPANRFPILAAPPHQGTRILVGTLLSLPSIGEHFSKDLLARPGSYAITAHNVGEYQEGIVAGADDRATLSAVYALLETLGFGFYLSYNASPRPAEEPFRFDHWRLNDYPVVPERIGFTWHNFLSSCSTWDLADWESWIRQLSRMRFTTIMVHAYGNNPMFTFSHNGETKPVGYLATSAKGRDWGTEHVNDVRRIMGGDKIYPGAVFGAEAALAPDDQRVSATVAMMQQAFALAARHGLKITFALDVDTEASNPQNVIGTLPEDARFKASGFNLVNPDVPAGYEYYRSQVKSLLSTYPEIGRIAVWIRAGRTTPWCSLKPQDFPPPWRTEYQDALASQEPDLQADPDAPSMFAINKIVKAYRKALDELGKDRVELAMGSWRFAWLRAADAFAPPEVMFIPLDYLIGVGTDEVQAALQAASKHRKVVPVVWAHHDDRTFVGRPYTPFASFTTLLAESGSAGYGIIHWTTRPLDLYFKSLAQQVWNQTRDQPLEVTCEQMAERTFGKAARDVGTQYLIRWITDAPMFGRETGDRFMDRPLVEPERVITECRGRIELLDKISKGALSPTASEQSNYYKDFERFMMAFYDTHSAWERSVDFTGKGVVESARRELALCKPKFTLEQYARAASHGGPTRGELGILIAMNLKWLPYLLSQRQALGLDPIRYHFESVDYEALAQSPGKYTFYFDQDRELWKAAGQRETHCPTFRLASPPFADQENLREMCQTGLQSSKTINLRLKTIAEQDLLSGAYSLRLWFVCPSSEAADNSVFDLILSTPEGAADLTQRIDTVRQAGGKDRVLQISVQAKIHGGALSVRLEPVKGSIYICGLMMEPAALPASLPA